jgi:hypothetical protein
VPPSRWTPTSGSNARDLYQRPPAQRRGFFYARHPVRRPRAPSSSTALEHPGRRPRAPPSSTRGAVPGASKRVLGHPLPARRSRLPAPGSRLPDPAPGPALPLPGRRSRCAARVPRLSGQNPGNPRFPARSAPRRPRAGGTRARAMFFTNNHQNFDMTSRGGILMLNVPYVSRETMI